MGTGKFVRYDRHMLPEGHFLHEQCDVMVKNA